MQKNEDKGICVFVRFPAKKINLPTDAFEFFVLVKTSVWTWKKIVIASSLSLQKQQQ